MKEKTGLFPYFDIRKVGSVGRCYGQNKRIDRLRLLLQGS